MVGAPETHARGCSEHTSRASTPAHRSNAQNSWAPTSRDPRRDFAASRKSVFSNVVSASSGSLYYEMLEPSMNKKGMDDYIFELLLILRPQRPTQPSFGDLEFGTEHNTGLLKTIFQ